MISSENLCMDCHQLKELHPTIIFKSVRDVGSSRLDPGVMEFSNQELRVNVMGYDSIFHMICEKFVDSKQIELF